MKLMKRFDRVRRDLDLLAKSCDRAVPLTAALDDKVELRRAAEVFRTLSSKALMQFFVVGTAQELLNNAAAAKTKE